MASLFDPVPPSSDAAAQAPSAPRTNHTRVLTIDTKKANYSRPHQHAVSVPITPRSSRTDRPKLPMRLRSNSGLSQHATEDALRRYTDYNANGSPRKPMFSTVAWNSIDDIATGGHGSTHQGPLETHVEDKLPIVDLLGHETFRHILSSPAVAARLARFEKAAGSSEGDVEFLLGVDSYARALDQFVDRLAQVPKPVDMPYAVTRALNSDMRHLTTSIIPGLESLFNESRSRVERRVWRETYPAFVKKQLSSYTCLALVGEQGLQATSFPGLGASFCLVDATVDDEPIVSTSDGFLALTGYKRREIQQRSCDFLHGSRTDPDVKDRLSRAILRGQATSELILNYQRDGTPFWNLVHLFPIVDGNGVVTHYLGAQINVSDTIASCDDMARVLSYEATDHEASQQRSAASVEPRTCSRSNTMDSTTERRPLARRRSSSTRSFLRQFKKNSVSNGPDPTCAPTYPSPPSSQASGTSMGSLAANQQRIDNSQPYSRILLLRHASSTKKSPFSPFSPLSSSSSSGSFGGKAKDMRLDIAFASQAALELLNVDAVSETPLGQDVFAVLSEHIETMSSTRAFRNTIREQVLRDGMSVNMELPLLPEKTSPLYRPRPSFGGSMSSRSAYTSSGDDRQSKSSLSRPSSRSGFSSLMGGGGGECNNMTAKVTTTTTWTPMKDGSGAVEWVVVVFAPV